MTTTKKTATNTKKTAWSEFGYARPNNGNGKSGNGDSQYLGVTIHRRVEKLHGKNSYN